MTMASTTAAPDDHVATARALREATRRVVHEEQLHVSFPVPGGVVTLAFPPPERLAFYAGVTVAASFGAISWPMALLAGIGHALADDHHNRTLEAIGEAIEAI